MNDIPQAAIDAAIAELWGFNYEQGPEMWTVSHEDVREMVEDALRAAWPHMQRCSCICHGEKGGTWRAHACEHCHSRKR